jgi:hypothetical protein
MRERGAIWAGPKQWTYSESIMTSQVCRFNETNIQSLLDLFPAVRNAVRTAKAIIAFQQPGSNQFPNGATKFKVSRMIVAGVEVEHTAKGVPIRSVTLSD